MARQTPAILVLFLLLISPAAGDAQDDGPRRVCPGVGMQAGAPDYGPGGLILTAFDASALWVYDVARARRYPLPDTRPCGFNCRLSPDARSITYFNLPTRAFNRMRLDGSERELVAEYASEVQWWSDDTFLIWTPGQEAYLRPQDGERREVLPVEGVSSVQPGGRWGVLVEQDGDRFERSLIDLETRGRTREVRRPLAPDVPYFNASAWSPDGRWLAFVAAVGLDSGAVVDASADERYGGELFAVDPASGAPPERWTNLMATYGPARINGQADGELSWSPDGSRIAFWVSELTGRDPEANVGTSLIHILETATGDVSVYCAFTTSGNTPNPPRLVWSPDGTHLAFASDMPDDQRGALLLGLEIETGIVTLLSQDVAAVFGTPEVFVWGLAP